MKYNNTLLTLLIPGPRQPGNDIDVYLESPIKDLKELGNKGVLILCMMSMRTSLLL